MFLQPLVHHHTHRCSCTVGFLQSIVQLFLSCRVISLFNQIAKVVLNHVAYTANFLDGYNSLKTWKLAYNIIPHEVSCQRVYRNQFYRFYNT